MAGILTAFNALTALAGGGQAGATQLLQGVNRVTTVATAGDSCVLPFTTDTPGLEVIVINKGAQPMAVFPATGDAINGLAANASVTMPPNSVESFYSTAFGVWDVEIGTGYAGSLFTEYSQDGITARAGGGQSLATQLVAQTSRVTTVATAGDSVKLPASAAGLELMVINHGANSMQVFGSGTDTIDDVAAATGVAQMPNSLVIYTCATAGAWYSEGLATGFGGPGLQTMSFANNLTALAGGQAGALALTAMVSRFTTVAAGNGAVLPASVAGLMITVVNRGANPLTVYGAGTDTINGVAGATGIAFPVNSVAVFYCTVAGTWESESVGQGFSSQFPTVSTTNGITAFAGGGQASAVLLTTVINRVTTVGTAGDSVKLPVSAPGVQVTVYNAAAANSMNVFPQTGDQINALGANTAFAVAAGKNATFGCPVAGQWHAILSA